MALRPLDNALPTTTPVRPTKKQVKAAVVLVPIQKQLLDLGVNVNDENKAPLPPPPEPDLTIDYISSENLKALPDPETKINGLIEGLESKDWMKVCESLNNARRFALYHSTLLLPILEKVMLVLVKSMKNPRSALCKTAIMASSDLFNAYSDNLIQSTTSDAFDQWLLQLLLKASQDKKFVCEEADKTLNTMVGSMTPLPLLHKLKVYATHTNPRIRAKSAISISHCVSNMGLEGMEQFGMVCLVQMAVNLLNDRLPEAREAARSITISIYKKFTENEEHKLESWEMFCQANLSPIHAQTMVKIIPPV